VRLQEQLQALDAHLALASGEQQRTQLAAAKARLLSSALADLALYSNSSNAGFGGVLQLLRKQYNHILAAQAGQWAGA
jgi:hypothetical protein